MPAAKVKKYHLNSDSILNFQVSGVNQKDLLNYLII
jgi:hypothetical protein